jgi:DNA-directed RNA polymerase subunit M/transcription elongation factor TFIIS
MKPIRIDLLKNFVATDEIYSDFYRCTSCNNEYLRTQDNFCSKCGAMLFWPHRVGKPMKVKMPKLPKRATE